MISLYTDCLALYFVKERDAMTQPKSDLAYLRSEKAKAEQQLRYYKHRAQSAWHMYSCNKADGWNIRYPK